MTAPSAVYANTEAAVFFERALAAARRLPELGGVDVAKVWEQLGDVRERSGAYDRALRAYRSARRLLREVPLVEARLFLKEAWIPERMGRFSEAVRAVRKGLAVLDGVSGVEAARQRAELSAWYAAMRQAQGRSREAVTWCERAIAEARESGSLAAEAHASFILDWAWFSIGRFDLATHSERALEIYAELGDLSSEAAVLLNQGGFAFYQGRWDEAVALFERSRAARQRTGNDVDAAMGSCNIAEVLTDQGRYEDAGTRARRRVASVPGGRLPLGCRLRQLPPGSDRGADRSPGSRPRALRRRPPRVRRRGSRRGCAGDRHAPRRMPRVGRPSRRSTRTGRFGAARFDE